MNKLNKAILVATDRIRYYKQQDKMLQSEIKRLTRNESTHRLCTRGGMVEAFIQEPEKLSNDQVMELLTVYLLKEYQRLKDEENDRLKLEWSAKRFLSKRNYLIHTDAVKN